MLLFSHTLQHFKDININYIHSTYVHTYVHVYYTRLCSSFVNVIIKGMECPSSQPS